MNLSNVANNILDLIFIPKCAACGIAIDSSKKALCDKCAYIYNLESKQLCTDCFMPYPYCKCTVHYGGHIFKMLRVTGYKIKENSVTKQMILGVKDNKHHAAFEMMADEMCRVLKRRAPEIAEVPKLGVIVWVPRSKKAKRDSGHDQSYELARLISKKTGIELADALISKEKQAQKSLNKEKRMENAEMSYDIIKGVYDFSHKNVIIVDDIVTTGASIGVCGEKLIKAGADSVTALVYSKTEHN